MIPYAAQAQVGRLPRRSAPRNDGYGAITRSVVALCIAAAATASAQEASPPTAEGIEFFETNVRPVLAEHCVECHGPDKQKNGLRLDTREAFLKGGDQGPLVQAGNPGASLLVRALRHEGDIQMPPAGRLEDGVIQAIEQWITIGAPWPEGGAAPIAKASMDVRIAQSQEKHWAFQPVQSPVPPNVAHPEQVANAIDAFILAKLEANGLAMSPPADRRTQLRRLSYDLTGLPPTDAEVEAFEKDVSPEAYTKALDALLASPRYGERWGRHWLDIARYSDTKGYVFQEERNYPYSYTYRDYVIRAFNEDLPFDQFVREQLAADMMDLGEDKRPLAALGFLTLGRRFINNIHDITDDRIDVVTRGLLGLTVSCARCHEHKFDPISDKDYYALYGVFRSATEPAEPPIIAEKSPDDPQYQDFLKAVAEKEKVLSDFLTEKHTELLTHAREKLGDYLVAAHDARDMDDEGLRGLAKDRALKWPLVQRWRDLIKSKKETQPEPIWRPYWAFAALPADAFEGPAVELAKNFAANADKDAPLNARIAKTFEGDAPKSMAEVMDRYRVALAASEGAWKELIAARVQIATQKGEVPELPTALEDGALEELRLLLYGPGAPPNMTLAEMEQFGDVPLRDGIRDRKNQIMAVKSTHAGRPDGAQSLVEVTPPFEPYVFLRGKPENRGEDVKRRFLAVLSGPDPKPFEQGSGRLELAEAIVSKDNPLTARVFVNRVWAQHFGKPLVGTLSDFGVRSDAPTHPELLDYLARYFMDHDWSVKALQRLIVTSYAFQQDSVDVAAAHALDPENALVWRQNRQRLDFEGLRDSLLVVSGGIDLAMGGPSVDITTAPYPMRRSVYSFIDRQNLPGVFRTFDFASPDAHSPKRYLTTVPQQALFMMNSPFVVEQARALAARPELADDADVATKIQSLYEIAYQRAPAAEELAGGEHFLAVAVSEPPLPPPWQYGYGTFDPAETRVTTLTPYPFFGSGAWKGGDKLPDATLGWSSITSGGGHPGRDNTFAPVRRWTAPSDGTVAIDVELTHGGECGDGVDGYIISSATGKLWNEHVKYSKAAAALVDIAVAAGDTIDFVVAPGENENCDGFGFAPKIRYTTMPGETGLGGTQQTEWSAVVDFAGPMPPPLQPLEQYAQVLLLSNEFAFVD